MYSLYRAWLSLGPVAHHQHFVQHQESVQHHQQQQTTPDVLLHVGPTMTQFSAHKTVLAAHSGWFKAALATQAGTAPIAVPNITPDEFSTLLTYMYTGYLDLTPTTIYNLILATHILHMPRALELCRSYLVDRQPQAAQPQAPPPPQPQQPIVVIKPIASKSAAPPTTKICPPTYGSLHKSEATSFREVVGSVTSTEDETKEGKVEKKGKAKRKVECGRAERTVVDVACCDGPVRFHRVINRNYGLPPINADVHRPSSDRTDAYNKAMSRQLSSDAENRGGGGNVAPQDLFTCVYCNHTFKSQYCYQKHARRHLNPVGVDAAAVRSSSPSASAAAASKREVKLLDMNVQYYPCKTCGCKFPSYYFVHKHRKLCHADEMAEGKGEVSGSAGEAVREALEDGSKDSCTIDVETVAAAQ